MTTMLPRGSRRWLKFVVLTLTWLAPSVAWALTPQIYWTNTTTDSIQSSNLDGSSVTTLPVGDFSLGVAVDEAAGKLYWTDLGNPNVANDETIRRANLDGSGAEVLVDVFDGVTSPVDIELDVLAAKMYWTDGGAPAGRIVRANLDGTNVETVFNVLDHRGPNFGSGAGQTLEFSQVWGLALDLTHGDMYWTDYFGADIHRAKLDGSGVSGPLVTGLTVPRGLALDPVSQRMYWVDAFDSTISSAALDGSDIQLVASDLVGVDEPFDVAIDRVSGKLYWTDMKLGEVWRADLDGQNPEALVVLLNQDLIGLAVVGPPPPAVPSLGAAGRGLLMALLAGFAARALARCSAPGRVTSIHPSCNGRMGIHA